MQRNVLLNDFAQITCLNCAVSSSVGAAHLFFERNVPDGLASLVAGERQGCAVTCETLTLDHFLRESNERAPTVLKADVEGSEMAVLVGAGGILLRQEPPMLLLKMEDAQFARHGTSKGEIQTMLSRLGFAAWQLKGRRWVYCPNVCHARCRNILWINPSVESHRTRAWAAGIRVEIET